jgi:hypothetical protein
MSHDPYGDLALVHAFALYEWHSESLDVIEDIYGEGRTKHYKATQDLLLAQYGLSWLYTQLRPDYKLKLVEAIESRYGDQARRFVDAQYDP